MLTKQRLEGGLDAWAWSLLKILFLPLPLPHLQAHQVSTLRNKEGRKGGREGERKKRK